MEDRSDTALVALRRILRATEFNARALARAAGLTPSQIIILRTIKSMENVSPGTIAKEASITQATVTALIDKLERRGFVKRTKDSVDRRRVIVSITAEGEGALVLAPDGLQERFRKRFDKLEPWEQSMVIASLERVATLLGAEEIDAAPVLDLGEIDEPFGVQ